MLLEEQEMHSDPSGVTGLTSGFVDSLYCQIFRWFDFVYFNVCVVCFCYSVSLTLILFQTLSFCVRLPVDNN